MSRLSVAPEDPNYDDDPIERSLKERIESGRMITSVVAAPTPPVKKNLN